MVISVPSSQDTEIYRAKQSPAYSFGGHHFPKGKETALQAGRREVQFRVIFGEPMRVHLTPRDVRSIVQPCSTMFNQYLTNLGQLGPFYGCSTW